MGFVVLFAVNYSPADPFDIGLSRWFAKPARLLHDYSLLLPCGTHLAAVIH
jgi:hypothetical protein